MATVSLSNFTKTVEKILDQYKEDVSAAVEPGLDEAEKYLIQELKSASPKDTGDYASHWQESSRSQGYRAIKNDKKVEWKNGHDQHLAGILEYSTNHAKPHIESTRRKARPKILKMLKESITKGAGKLPKGD